MEGQNKRKLNLSLIDDDNFKISKVKVYPKKKAWDIYMKSNEDIKIEDLKKKETELSELYNINKIRIIIEIFKMTEGIKDWLKISWDNVTKEIMRRNPRFTGFLKGSSINLDDDKILINIGTNIALNFLKDEKFEEVLKEVLIKYYGLKINLPIRYHVQQNNDKVYTRDTNNEESKIVADILKKVSMETEHNQNNGKVIYGRIIKGKTITRIHELNEESGRVTVEGIIFDVESKLLNNGKSIVSFCITDYSSSISCKLFTKEGCNVKELVGKFSNSYFVRVRGDVQLDNYLKEIVLYVNSIESIAIELRSDNSEEKRIELHAHTNMSAMDGISTAEELVKRAKEWGHDAIAITDHGIVQAFPEAYEASKKYGVKVIYGVEGYLVNDIVPIVFRAIDYCFEDEFVVFDIETTGLSNINNAITEIGAVIVKDGEIIDRYSSLINPETRIPDKIIRLTGITNDMVANERTIDIVLKEFLDFIGDRPLVAHNASFDWGFIKNKAKLLGYEISNALIDTLQLSRVLIPIKRHRLDSVCKHMGVNIKNHHRAQDDAEATAEIFIKMLKILEARGINNIIQINSIAKEIANFKSAETYHITILVKNNLGLKNLYKLISVSHIDYFYKRPRILKSVLEKYREGLIIGSACEAGEVFQSVLKNIDEDMLIEKLSFYDYFEIQPLGNNEFMIRNGILDRERLININKSILALGKELNKPVVATGDVHFLDPKDEVFRRILMAGQGYSDADNQAPLYYRTTEEMLDEFQYLDDKSSYEIVVKNPKRISDSIEKIIPIPEDTFPPQIEGAEEKVREMAMGKAHDIYGKVLPEIVENRLQKELNSIINNGYAVMYLIAYKLVSKSLKDGYMVGSRGSVGSSFVATLCDITEVNPLPPHYICLNCSYSLFYTDGSVGSGVDLPDRTCPECGERLKKDGHDIPFEIFLGFEGEKEPDIDLNFASEYQGEAHKYTEKIFGAEHVFRAGTIGTIADKTAYGFIKKYYDERNRPLNSAEVKRLINGCVGIKRTTGQHPGGIMIVPSDKDIYEFTPIQRPADDTDSSVITTHFDYRSISGRLLKLDILGHDVPTIIKMLEDITGYPADEISFDNEDTMSLFVSTEALGVDLKDIDCGVGTLGIPEFGTKFVRQMLMDTKPTTFSELVRISGLSHGTDVWLNNAQDLIRQGVATLKEVISTRDDIMLYLVYKGLKPNIAFKIAENVRKGKGLTDKQEEYMRENSIPKWYINSCKVIKYLFPKAHATAYVMMSFRIAYYKVFYPEAFYASYFTARINDFDADLLMGDKEFIKSKWIELNKKGNNATTKEKNLITIMEVAYEMYSRGIRFLPVDLYKSEAERFLIVDKDILLPLRSLQGLGINAAISVVEQRNKEKFISLEDLRERTKISKTVIEIMRNHGCLNELPETNQISLF